MSPQHTPDSPLPDLRPGSDAHQRRVEALRQAAAAKRRAAVHRAETGLRKLIKTGEEVNFRSAARAGGVSLDFLYAHPDLRQRIESLRSQQQPARPVQPPSDGDNNLIHTLTAKLKHERTVNRTYVAELEHRLAAAHGEILQLRRRLQQCGLLETHVADASATSPTADTQQDH